VKEKTKRIGLGDVGNGGEVRKSAIDKKTRNSLCSNKKGIFLEGSGGTSNSGGEV